MERERVSRKVCTSQSVQERKICSARPHLGHKSVIF